MKFKITLLVTGLLMANVVSAATAIDLRNQPAAFLQRHLVVQKTALTPTRTYLDFNQTAHTRIQQTYAGVPVWNATGIVHTPHAKSSNARAMLSRTTNLTTMNGTIYEGLEKDLLNVPAFALSDAQKNTALQLAKANYAKKSGASSLNFTKDSAQQIIFIDDNSQAHYGWLVSFYADDLATGAHRPTAIIDAATLKFFHTWDQVMTIDSRLETKEAKAAIAKLANNNRDDLYPIVAGGISGNEKIGEEIHDGASGHHAAMNIVAEDITYERTPGEPIKFTLCALMTDDIVVTDVSYGDQPAYDVCVKNPNAHNGVAWLSNDKNQTRWAKDMMNGGYSPAIDAFSAASLIKEFYQEWYQIPALVDAAGNPMPMVMRVHYGRSFDNAFWDGEVMTFGDGGKIFYPLTSLGVAAHEISHGFTSQHSGITGEYPQMGALHESFSDMAAVALEFYQNKSNHWEIGREVKKGEGALRYLDQPTRDGHSIDNIKDFENIESHSGAGVFNKAFYLIATTKGWDTHKAFNTMVKANMNYWTASMQTMAEAACGVLAATNDYKYNIADVRVAFTKVGIDTDNCGIH